MANVKMTQSRRTWNRNIWTENIGKLKAKKQDVAVISWVEDNFWNLTIFNWCSIVNTCSIRELECDFTPRWCVMCDNVMCNLPLAFCAVEWVWTLYTCSLYVRYCFACFITTTEYMSNNSVTWPWHPFLYSSVFATISLCNKSRAAR